MHKSNIGVSNKLSKRNRLMLYGSRLKSLVSKDTEYISLTFVLVKDSRHGYSRYWKILTVYNDKIIDVSYDVGVVLDLYLVYGNIIRTSSYGVSIEEDICRRLESVFKMVYNKTIRFSYSFVNAALE